MGSNLYGHAPFAVAPPPPPPATTTVTGRIFDLRGQEGHFETEPVGDGTAGIRTFGLWSFADVVPGDLVIKPKIDEPETPTLWVVLSARSTFRGSNEERWWEGTMQDLIRTGGITRQVVEMVERHEAGRAPHAFGA